MADIQRYLNLVTSQHQNKPKFTVWLSSTLSILDDANTLAVNFNTYFDLDLAVGAQLDVLGKIVGVSRNVSYQPLDGSSPVLSDNSYRILIKVKISKNSWDGTIPSIYNLWKNIFPQFGIRVIDNQNMSMKAVLTGQIDSSTQQLIDNAYIVPKPMGVSLTIEGLTSASLSPYIGMAITTNDDETVSMVNPSFAGNSTADMFGVAGMVPSTVDSITVIMKQP